MTFSVKLPSGRRALERAGGNLDQVFTQRRKLFNFPFLRMLRDILRFNRAASALAAAGTVPDLTLGAYLDAHGRICDVALQQIPVSTRSHGFTWIH